MDTRIWMQESFWESTEEQNGKRESAGKRWTSLKKTSMKTAEISRWIKRQVSGSRRMRISWLGWECVDHAELSSIKLYPAFDRYFDDLSGTTEIKERKPMVSECIWACWDQTASTIFLLIVGTYIGRERIEAAEAWKIVSILVGILPLLILSVSFTV